MSLTRKKGTDAAREFLSFINDFGAEEEDFAEAVCSDHRTLQQSTMRVFMRCVQKWAKAYESKHYDLRNEATCRLSSEIVKIKDAYLPMV